MSFVTSTCTCVMSALSIPGALSVFPGRHVEAFAMPSRRTIPVHWSGSLLAATSCPWSAAAAGLAADCVASR